VRRPTCPSIQSDRISVYRKVGRINPCGRRKWWKRKKRDVMNDNRHRNPSAVEQVITVSRGSEDVQIGREDKSGNFRNRQEKLLLRMSIDEWGGGNPYKNLLCHSAFLRFLVPYWTITGVICRMYDTECRNTPGQRLSQEFRSRFKSSGLCSLETAYVAKFNDPRICRHITLNVINSTLRDNEVWIR
jgi:hypothetical protein